MSCESINVSILCISIKATIPHDSTECYRDVKLILYTQHLHLNSSLSVGGKIFQDLAKYVPCQSVVWFQSASVKQMLCELEIDTAGGWWQKIMKIDPLILNGAWSRSCSGLFLFSTSVLMLCSKLWTRLCVDYNRLFSTLFRVLPSFRQLAVYWGGGEKNQFEPAFATHVFIICQGLSAWYRCKLVRAVSCKLKLILQVTSAGH